MIPPSVDRRFLFIMEIWKEIKYYPDYYVSSLGNVKSLKFGKERILKVGISTKGYKMISMCKNGIQKTKSVHQLVAIAFLNHNPNGMELVVNHINFIRTDNRLENLEIVTNRENCNHKHLKSTSKYIGVAWHKNKKKWQSEIIIGKKKIYLGIFETELEANEAYKNKLLTLNK